MPENHQTNRRRLLKALAGAGGVVTAGKLLPETWTRPVVDAVSLPAHAQTSGVFYDVVDVPMIEGSAPPSGGGILDLVVPTAYAQDGSSAAHICVFPNGDEAQVDLVLTGFFLSPGFGLRYGGMPTIGGGKEPLDALAGPDDCPRPAFPPVEIRLDSVAAGALFLFGDEIEIPFDLPQQACNLPGLGSCPDLDDDDDIIILPDV